MWSFEQLAAQLGERLVRFLEHGEDRGYARRR
jgi:hypothetical protein